MDVISKRRPRHVRRKHYVLGSPVAPHKPLEVNADHPIPVGRGDGFDRTRAGCAGIVAEDVNVAELRKSSCRSLGEGLTVGYIAGRPDDPNAIAAQHFDGICARRRLDVGDRHVHAALTKGAAQRQADAACAAGDEGGLSLELIHRLVRPG